MALSRPLTAQAVEQLLPRERTALAFLRVPLGWRSSRRSRRASLVSGHAGGNWPARSRAASRVIPPGSPRLLLSRHLLPRRAKVTLSRHLLPGRPKPLLSRHVLRVRAKLLPIRNVLRGRAKFLRSALEGGKATIVACPMSNEQAQLQQEFVARFEWLRREKVDPREDNALATNTDGRKLAIDARMLSPAARSFGAQRSMRWQSESRPSGAAPRQSAALR